MSFYSQELVEEIRSRSDIVDVINSYVRLQRKGSNYVGVCPFHNDHSPSMSVNQPRQMYRCFSCGAGGDVFKFVMDYENLTFPEALKVLADRAGIELPERNVSREEREQEDLNICWEDSYPWRRFRSLDSDIPGRRDMSFTDI